MWSPHKRPTGAREIVDRTVVSFMDSTGLETLLRSSQAHDGRLILVGLPARVRRILEITDTCRFDRTDASAIANSRGTAVNRREW